MPAFVRTETGYVRKKNEDSFAFLPPYVFAVADGMGGHLAGEVASRIVVDFISDFFRDQKPPFTEECLRDTVNRANRLILEAAAANPEYTGMGTTLTLAVVEPRRLMWAHVGDSRLYIYRSGQLKQVTNDHSLAAELARLGKITRVEAEIHPQKNILTRALGVVGGLEVETGWTALQPGDRILLCSDGLTGMLSDDRICHLWRRLENDANREDIVLDALVEAALNEGGLDNITAILVAPEE